MFQLSLVVFKRLQSSIAIISLGMLLSFFSGLSFANEYPRASIPFTEIRELHGSVNQTDYRLSIALPESHVAGSDKTYPVLFVLDANVAFASVVQTQRILLLGNEAPEIIIVGIGYPTASTSEWFRRRFIDLTQTQSSEAEAQVKASWEEDVKSGGADQFLKVLRDELIPFVEKNYPVNQDRALVGDSLGGLFSTYAMVHAPNLFSRFIIASPSLWWDNELGIKQVEDYGKAHDDLSAMVFIAYGSDESPLITGPSAKLIKHLNEQGYSSLNLKHNVFPGETHLSVPPAVYSRGLREIYAE